MVDIAGLRFLVVEDHAFQRWALGHALQALGARNVFNAGDGRTALEIYKSADPAVDIVLTDLNMPGMDGMELIRHLAQSHNGAALIVATDQEPGLLASVEKMARSYGANLLAGIRKPVTAQKLADAIGLYRPARPRQGPSPSLHFEPDEIEAGLRADEFLPFFVPRARLAGGRIVGAEALPRWRHSSHGMLGPEFFIGALEAGGRVDCLMTLMLRKALECCRTWRTAGIDANLSLDVPFVSLADLTWADRVIETVNQAGLPPNSVVLEVAETVAASASGKVLENLARLRLNGFGLCVDHYGSARCSPDDLARAPFTALKIDASVVRRMRMDPEARAGLERGLSLAKAMGIASMAEGVDSAQDAALLREAGCETVQGTLIGAPMKSALFLRWVLEHEKARER